MKTVTNRVEVKSDSRLGFSGVIEREYEEIRKVLQGRAVVMVVIERKATTAIANRRYDDDVIVIVFDFFFFF